MTVHRLLDLEFAEKEAWALRRQKGIPNDRRLWVLACMDERLPVESALGIREGDAHVFRNAGGLVTDDALRSALLTTNFFGTKEIIVVNHTECGMMSATGEALTAALADPEAQVREQTAWALGMIGDPAAMDALTDAMKDESAKVRKQAIWAIGMLHHE